MLNDRVALKKAALMFTAAFLLFQTSCQTFERGWSQKHAESLYQYLSKNPLPEKSRLSADCDAEIQLACGLMGAPTGLNRPLSILQGWTTSNAARFSIVVPKGEQLKYLILSKSGADLQIKNLFIEATKTFIRADSPWGVDHLEVSGLVIGQEYELWVADGSGQVWDRRQFKALDENLSKPRVVVVSCMDDGYWREQNVAWLKIYERSPDIMFFLGDNVYGDKYLSPSSGLGSPKSLWRRYVEMRNTLGVYRWPKLTPIMATWDDHDYGSNGGGVDFNFKNESREIFWTFFPQSRELGSWKMGPGVSSSVHLFGQEFLLADDRSFRTPDRQIDLNQTHFGKDQEAWIDARLAEGTAPLWLMNGDQFFGAYHKFESFEAGHPIAFDRFRGALRKSRRPAVLVSGDRHLAELMRISKKDVGFETYELTSSGIHAKTFPNSLEMNPNPRRIAGAAGPLNFLEIEPRVSGKVLRAKIRAFGVFEGLLYERDLTVRRTSP